jgi:hypothetical protein
LSKGEIDTVNAYQDSVAQLTGTRTPLTITVDSLYCQPGREYHGELIANISIHNNTTMRLYLLKSYPCMRRLLASIVGERGDTVKVREAFIDFMGEKCKYDSSDLFVLPPGQTIQYPRSIIWLRSCRSLSPGSYSVSVSYSYQRPAKLFELRGFRKSQLLTYLYPVEGTYTSQIAWNLNVTEADH